MAKAYTSPHSNVSCARLNPPYKRRWNISLQGSEFPFETLYAGSFSVPSRNSDQHPGYLVTQAPTASLQLCVNSKSPSRAVHDFPWFSAPGESNPRKYSENFASSKSSLGVPSCVVPCLRREGRGQRGRTGGRASCQSCRYRI